MRSSRKDASSRLPSTGPPRVSGMSRVGPSRSGQMEYHARPRVIVTAVGMSESRVLVVSATGQLGSVITRKLVASGTTVRALARNGKALAPLATGGRNRGGRPSRSPEAHRSLSRRRADRRHGQQQHGTGAHQSIPDRSRRLPEPLCRRAQHRRPTVDLRLVRGRRAGRAGRYLPIKWYIEDAIRRSGVPT